MINKNYLYYWWCSKCQTWVGSKCWWVDKRGRKKCLCRFCGRMMSRRKKNKAEPKSYCFSSYKRRLN